MCSKLQLDLGVIMGQREDNLLQNHNAQLGRAGQTLLKPQALQSLLSWTVHCPYGKESTLSSPWGFCSGKDREIFIRFALEQGELQISRHGTSFFTIQYLYCFLNIYLYNKRQWKLNSEREREIMKERIESAREIMALSDKNPR